MRILQGLYPSAGQPALLAVGLRQLGHDAVSISTSRHSFNYTSDIELQCTAGTDYEFLLTELGPSFDILHLHALSPLEIGKPTRNLAFTLLGLKARGVKIVIHFRGSEARLPSIFRQVNPYHYVDEDPDGIISTWHENRVASCHEFWREIADAQLVVDPELATYVPEADIVPRVIDERIFTPKTKRKSDVPLVVHAPSRRGVKGTEAVLQSVENLRRLGVRFEFELIENRAHQDLAVLLQRADVVVDQLRIGWYGVLGVEAMATGNAVICYVREDLKHHLSADAPVVFASESNLTVQLMALIEEKERRAEASDRAYDYFQRNHRLKDIAVQCESIYESVMSSSAALFDLGVVNRLASLSSDKGVRSRPVVEAVPFVSRGSRMRRTFRFIRSRGYSRLFYEVCRSLRDDGVAMTSSRVREFVKYRL